MTGLLLLSLVGVGAGPFAGYELVTKSAGVTVYRHLGAHGVELFAEGDIAAPPQRVQTVLLDYEHHDRFAKNVAESRIVRREAAVFWVYQRLNLPVISDRDFTLKVTWGQAGESLWTHFVCDNEQGPPAQKGVVRVVVHEGRWTLAPSAGGQATHATYQVRLDLAGTLPDWMARSGTAKEIPALFEGLRRQVL